MNFDFDDIFKIAIDDELSSHDSREMEETIEMWHERIFHDYDLLLIYEVDLEYHHYDDVFGRRARVTHNFFYNTVRDIKMLNATFEVSDVRYFVMPGQGSNSFIGRNLNYNDKFLPRYFNVKANKLYIMCGLSNRRTTISKTMLTIGLLSQRIRGGYNQRTRGGYRMTTYLLKKIVEERSNELGILYQTTYDQYIAQVPELVTLSEHAFNVISTSFSNDFSKFQHLVWFIENTISFDKAREEVRKMYMTLSNYSNIHRIINGSSAKYTTNLINE